MHDLERILSACRRAITEGRPSVLATVVRVEGSAYRRPGARMLMSPGEPPTGMISGGCVEADVRERMPALIASARPEVATYDLRSAEEWVWGMGGGCGGEIRVLLEPLLPFAPPAYLELLELVSSRREPRVLVTVYAVGGRSDLAVGDRFSLEAPGPIDSAFLAPARAVLAERRSSVFAPRGEDGVQALVEYVAPTTQLLIFGAESDAVPVVAFARELGWLVTVVDDGGPPALTIDEATAAIVMTHRYEHDLALLRWLVTTRAAYIGILGPQRRSVRLLEEIERGETELSPARCATIHAPVGIDLGAETPSEIALAIVAEVQAVLSGRSGGFLRERSAPLHDTPCSIDDPR